MDAPAGAIRFLNSSLRNQATETGYKLYIVPQVRKQLDAMHSHTRVQAEKRIQLLASVPRPKSTGQLAFQLDGGNYMLVTKHVAVLYRIGASKITILSLQEIKEVIALPAESTAAQKIADCIGRCHGVPGRGEWKQMDPEQNGAFTSATLSTIGAVTAGIGCRSTGVSCGLAVVLAADAARQFYKTGTDEDPVVILTVDRGASVHNAENIAAAVNYMTAVISIHGAYKGLFMRSPQNLSAGSLGALYADGLSTVHTVKELKRSQVPHK